LIPFRIPDTIGANGLNDSNAPNRDKKPSKSLRDRYGHTPLSAQERIPWGGNRLIIGTGVYGSLPVTPEVNEEAEPRNIELIVLPTREACRLLDDFISPGGSVHIDWQRQRIKVSGALGLSDRLIIRAQCYEI